MKTELVVLKSIMAITVTVRFDNASYLSFLLPNFDQNCNNNDFYTLTENHPRGWQDKVERDPKICSRLTC